MGKKQRREQASVDHAQLLSRELGWLEAVSHHKTKVIFGAPMRCPTTDCGDFGLVEGIDQGRQHNRCWSCGMTWTLSTQAMAMYAQACAAAPEQPGVVGAGTLVADLEPASAARTTRERIAEALHREPSTPLRYLPNS